MIAAGAGVSDGFAFTGEPPTRLALPSHPRSPSPLPEGTSDQEQEIAKSTGHEEPEDAGEKRDPSLLHSQSHAHTTPSANCCNSVS